MIQNININKLYPHLNNLRKDLGDLTELAESIKTRGIMQNLTVVTRDDGKCITCKHVIPATGKCFLGTEGWGGSGRCPNHEGRGDFTVVIGHRRLAAAKLAGLTELPCVVVEMTEQEQVGTMLLENMQRTDLTIYEQAQGFQMLLDFGESVTDIAEKTGFSQTTVRRRVKLLELDQDSFKKSMARGATLMDYVELEKIKNIKTRNQVLTHIGTNNFDWQLNSAIEQEAMPERQEKLLQFLEGWAQRIKKVPKNPYDYVKYFYKYDMDDFKKPKDADTGDYTFFDSGTDIKLYKEKDKSDKIQASAAEKSFKECEIRIKALTKRAFELRRNFVKSFGGGKKQIEGVMAFAMIRLIRYGGSSLDELLKLLEIKAPEEYKTYMEEVKTKQGLIFQKYLKQPERTMLAIAWATIDSGEKYYSSQSYNLAIVYESNTTLDAIYDGLIALGYEMSDDERALRDGTHDLYTNEVEHEKTAI